MASTQLVVVGAGPGGYAAAFLAADLGLSVTLVGTDPNPGGVCLYRGCIPSKALLHAAKLVEDARHGSALGLEFGEPRIDVGKLRRWKQQVTVVELDERGFVKVNRRMQTADARIFAIGDVVGEPMLAHKASHEGRVAVEVIAGREASFEPRAIPAVVFTDPEVAWCGLTETQAKREGRPIEVARFPWAASGRAITLGRTDGLTKLLLDPVDGRVLGVGLVGPGAGELIAEGALAMEMGATAQDLALTIHPHPTLSETVMESAEVFFGHATHLYRPKRATAT